MISLSAFAAKENDDFLTFDNSNNDTPMTIRNDSQAGYEFVRIPAYSVTKLKHSAIKERTGSIAKILVCTCNGGSAETCFSGFYVNVKKPIMEIVEVDEGTTSRFKINVDLNNKYVDIIPR